MLKSFGDRCSIVLLIALKGKLGAAFDGFAEFVGGDGQLYIYIFLAVFFCDLCPYMLWLMLVLSLFRQR